MKASLHVLLIVASLFTIPAQASELQVCTTDPLSPIREHSDVRIRNIFLSVLQKAGMNPGDYGLCEYGGLTMRTLGVVKNDDTNMIAVLVPASARSLSEDELEGEFAHEIGHVAIGPYRPHSIETEMAADKKAAEWVGVEKVLAMLKGSQRDLSQIPRAWTPAVQEELNERIQALKR